MKNKIIQGDSLAVLKTLPSESVDCCITSPPYWALRDYGVVGQLGLEPTFQEYITKLCDMFDEVKRVLKKDGTCWVNLGDTYSGNKEGKTDNKVSQYLKDTSKGISKKATITEKCLCQIPSRFAIEMTNPKRKYGPYILRNEIIWHKPNCMPSSVTDRFTVDFEKVFFFVKSKKYYFEQQFTELQGNPKDKERQSRTGNLDQKYVKLGHGKPSSGGVGYSENGRNRRTVWSINTLPLKEAHFATFPEKLIEPMILAGCPKKTCKHCHKAV